MEISIDTEKIKNGDAVEFRRFFEYFYPKLTAFVCRFVDEVTAKDIVQEVFTSYWEKKSEIRADCIQSYLYRWTQNLCLNHIKHQSIVKDYEARVRIAEARIEYLNKTSDFSDALKVIMDNDIIRLVEASVNKLPPKSAEVFRLCYFDDMSHKEIAEHLQLSVRTVEWHIRQSVLFLRKDLRDLLTLIFMFYNIN
ncbi:MAG: RNA polymerase sigma-70 factor [Tannerella sp.]|jgi:RNA polymerase sigma-70 factor (ECF subfamily)|nr:RNA polymerase sigma-70 factor [Tannerella sp.]